MSYQSTYFILETFKSKQISKIKTYVVIANIIEKMRFFFIIGNLTTPALQAKKILFT